MDVMERRLFGDSRAWVCGRADGDTLEIAIGTGANLEHYPPSIALTGVDFSAPMLHLARKRAEALGWTSRSIRATPTRLRMPTLHSTA